LVGCLDVLAEVRQLKVFSFFFKRNMVDSSQSEAIG
jgi:hypothetical protein